VIGSVVLRDFWLNEKLSQKSGGDVFRQEADFQCWKVIYTKIDKWEVIERG
jgi:hypothetical protein